MRTQISISSCKNPINFIKRCHNKRYSGISNQHFKRFQIKFPQCTFRKDGIYRIVPLLRTSSSIRFLFIHGKMFGADADRMIFLNALCNLDRTDSGQIRILRKIFKISPAKRIPVQIDCWCQPYVNRFLFALCANRISKRFPQFFIECAGNQHSRWPGPRSHTCRSIFIKNGMNTFFWHSRGDISFCSDWMIVFGHWISLTIQYSFRLFLFAERCKWNSRSIPHTQCSQLFDTEIFYLFHFIP